MKNENDKTSFPMPLDYLPPIFCNAAHINTFKYGKEEYVVMTFVFQGPPKADGIPHFIPATKVVIPKVAYKAIMIKFLGHIALQEEGKMPPNLEGPK